MAGHHCWIGIISCWEQYNITIFHVRLDRGGLDFSSLIFSSKEDVVALSHQTTVISVGVFVMSLLLSPFIYKPHIYPFKTSPRKKTEKEFLRYPKGISVNIYEVVP